MFLSTPPKIAINTPADGATYLLNAPIAAAYTCNDSLSGIPTTGGCTGTVNNGSNIPASTVGPNKTFTVNATDKAGNTASLSTTYSVVYNFIPSTSKNLANLGSAVPLNWQLRDGRNATVNNLNTLLSMESVFNGSSVPPGGCVASSDGSREILYSQPSGATGNSDFRLVAGGYQFNVDTTFAITAPGITGKGCYTVLIYLNDQSAPKMMNFQLK